MANQLFTTFAVALAFAAVHVVGWRLRFIDVTPRSVWLSAAGGVSVAYVFVHLMPELAQGQAALVRHGGPALAFLEHHAYLLSLLGLTVFHGLERLAVRSKRRHRGAGGGGSQTGPAGFAVHIGAFALYNLMVGYLLHDRARNPESALPLYGVAMGLHFLVNDYGLRQHHRDRYLHAGRWLLAAAVLCGWLLGWQVRVGDAAVHVVLALLAGAVVLNVLKEELPEGRESRFGAFAAGALGYAALLVSL